MNLLRFKLRHEIVSKKDIDWSTISSYGLPEINQKISTFEKKVEQTNAL